MMTVRLSESLSIASIGTAEKRCDTHGAFTSRGTRLGGREIWTSCPVCAAERDERERLEREARRQEGLKVQLEEMLAQTAIPERFIGRTLDNYRAETDGQRKALEICRAFADNFDRHVKVGTSLVMSGLPGTGKSHLAGAILQAILPRHVGVYVTLMDLIRMVRETWRRDSETSESALLARLQSVPLLVIDEIGMQYGTDGERAIVFDVLDRRYRSMKPVILMTNLGKDELRAAVVERVFDRLTEVARWMPFDWPSFRAQARRELRDVAA
jgi:DNA replication protein DnaC